MARQTADKEALHLYELLGAPLLAVVQAEAQAAQASAEFIRRIGFEDPATNQGADAQSDPTLLQEGGHLGQLKMARFTHPISGADGRVKNHETQIPVLSLFPLPLLQVKHGEFEFAVTIIEHSAVVPDDHGEADSRPPDALQASGDAAPRDFLSSHRLQMKAAVARQSTGTGERHMDMQMKVKIRMEQADLPSGIIKLLNLMDRSIHSSPQSLADENPSQKGKQPL